MPLLVQPKDKNCQKETAKKKMESPAWFIDPFGDDLMDP
jgi:hypothetical protein